MDIIIDGGADNTAAEASETVAELDADAIPVARLGDVWMLGHHRLLCGNALEATAYRTLMGDERARMVFTGIPVGLAASFEPSFFDRV
ncbi:MAG: hypothetical protein ACX93P_11275 [Roseovarius sp.]